MGGVLDKGFDFVADVATLGQGDKVQQALGLKDPASKKYAERAYQEFATLNAPKLPGEMLKSAGDFSTTVVDGQQSKEGRAAQLEALKNLRDITSGGGFSLQEKAAMDQINRQVNQQNAAMMQQNLQQAALRGTARSGTDIFANLVGSQGLADRRAQMGLQTGAMGADRMLQATRSIADVGSGIRGADENMSRFNAAQQTAARQMQLQNLQRISDVNVGLRNELPQQQFENEMRLRAARSGALGNIGASADVAAGRLGSLIGTGIQAFAPKKGAATTVIQQAPAQNPASDYPGTLV